jgi:outer membrane protein assembly factor BamA
LGYLQNHGYPEARIGEARVSKYQEDTRRWLPWPHEERSERLEVAIPVEAGPLYRVDEVEVGDALEKAAMQRRKEDAVHSDSERGKVFSAQDIENRRRFWQAVAQPRWKPDSMGLEFFSVEARQTMDTTAHKVRVEYDFGPKPGYAVRRIEFLGNHRFPDSYFRKRIGLEEGAPFDDRALEAGLKRLARTNYFKPVKKEDIHVEPDEAARTVDVTIKVEERGQQRLMLTGGSGQFGNTLGIAYSVFNMLGLQELLSSHIDGGPETLQLALGFAIEGFLGSRATLGLSVFNTFLRPALTGSVRGPFFKTQTEGVSADWSYPLSDSNAIHLSYGLSRSSTQYSLNLPAGLTGPSVANAQTNSSSHWVGAGWTHNTGNQRITLNDSVSGGFLGGSENLLRSSGEYARIIRDPIFNRQNAWAFRTTFSAVGSYSGDMPFYTRLFPGDEFVRGLGIGDLGPQEAVLSTTSGGASKYSTTAAGANLITAANLEYRVPLKNGVEMAGFFDVGAGRVLPNWLGRTRPALIESTNGLLHGSTGIEWRWTVPGLGAPVRFYYSLNVLRLTRFLTMPDGSLLRSRVPFSRFGWGMGSLF